MAVTVINRDYTNQFRSEQVDWLLGNVGDWQNLGLIVRFAVEARIESSSAVSLLVGNIVKREDGKNWGDFGFDVGDTIYMDCTGHSEGEISGGGSFTADWVVNWNGRTITSLQGDEMTISGADITLVGIPYSGIETTGSFNRLPYQDGKNVTSKSMLIYADKKPQGIEIIYGHLENSSADSANLNSFIDGSITRFTALNTDTLTGWQLFEKVDVQSGMAVEGASWNFYGKIGSHTYQYAISINFMLASFFEDLSNFENNIAPSQVFAAESLTDNFIITGFPEWNNPNTIIRSDLKKTKRLGNTGWFGENFNGLENDFTIKSVEYTDIASNTSTDGLSFASETKIKAKIGGIQNMANGLSKYAMGFIWLPEEESFYKDLSTSLHENLLVNTCGGYSIGVFPQSPLPNPSIYTGFYTNSSNRMDVKNVRFYQSGSDLIYEAIFIPTIGFKNFINSLGDVDRGYAIWISVGDRLLVTNFSNRVSLLLDYNKLKMFIPPVGEWEGMNIGFYEHTDDGTDSVISQCGNDFFVEDDILALSKFKVDITKEIPNAIEFAIEMENITTGAKFNLQNYKVDLSIYPLNSSGVPQWDYDEIRGFKLEPGNNKNWVKVKRDSTQDSGDEYGYSAYFAFKLRWEHWIQKTGVPGDFFDSAEAFNGFNNDWFQYLGTLGWQMNYTVYLESTLDGTPVKYVNSVPLTFRDYNDNANLTKEWNFYRNSDNTLINAGVDPVSGEPLGVILENEQTKVEVIYTRGIGTWASLINVYGTLCIEVDNGSGQFEFRQLSSFWGSESDNPLIPLAGETKAKLTLISPTQLKIECLVEPSLLLNAIRFKHSSRLGCIIG